MSKNLSKQDWDNICHLKNTKNEKSLSDFGGFFQEHQEHSSSHNLKLTKINLKWSKIYEKTCYWYIKT